MVSFSGLYGLEYTTGTAVTQNCEYMSYHVVKPWSPHIVISHVAVTLEMEESRQGKEKALRWSDWEHTSVFRHLASSSVPTRVLAVCLGFISEIGIMTIYLKIFENGK